MWPSKVGEGAAGKAWLRPSVSLEGRARKEVSSFGAAELAREAATDGLVWCPHRRKETYTQAKHSHNPQIQGKILDAYTNVCSKSFDCGLSFFHLSSIHPLLSVPLWPHLCWPNWSPELPCHALPPLDFLQPLLPSLLSFKLSLVSQLWSCP